VALITYLEHCLSLELDRNLMTPKRLVFGLFLDHLENVNLDNRGLDVGRV